MGFQLACFPCPLPSVAPAGLPSESSEHLESGAARRGGRGGGGGRGTLCSSGAPMDSPPGPPRRTANQNHSARMGTRRAPSCSQRPPGDLTRCQASLAAQRWGCSGLMTPPAHPTLNHPQRHHQAVGFPQLNEASTCCSLAAYIRAVALGKALHPAFAGGLLGAGHPAGQCVNFRDTQASGMKSREFETKKSGSKWLHHF